MSLDQIVALLAVTVVTGTPLIFAAIGELLAERSGVLNLGVGGVMLVGAVSGFAVAALTRHPWMAVIAAATPGGPIAAGPALAAGSLGAGYGATRLPPARFRAGRGAF